MIMQGKKGLIMGLANKFSIAYGIAESLKSQGAELIFTSQTEYFKNKISDIAKEFGKREIILCDVSKDGEIEKAFDEILQTVGNLDFIVHSIAFADKNELTGKYYNTSRANFLNAMNVSCFSFTETCKYAPKLMPNGGSLVTLTYYGSEKVVPNYNVMALAKSALETSVRYLATDLGESHVRVNAISAGPIKTLAASGVGEFSKILEIERFRSPLRRNVTQKDIGDACTFLLSDMASGITGEIIHVDCGCNTVGVKFEPKS
ncbi:MAG: enoyl-ACP reductase [Holosporales bacterium]|jgi:enoyl-[acyl-carrier protein] reductase I|nr:enoyl-ACP reductase [Holosporales bacterium]